ncbi:MAG TPA: 16S rRNA (cytosine(967)-C(5))-methyltransferase RsmB [Solirubrobacteraceae bacterium]|nr:16S rRNA (cytosine(967)-C(5))-methyltransferase RsmB [Solirubrobacteraceae bacterium]
MAVARACAYAVVRRVFEEDAYADRALHAEAEGLAPRDRGLATRLAYGVVQRKATLDHVIQALARRPTTKLEPAVLAALRLGVFQLAFMDRVPAHAAVGESVELAKGDSRGGAGLVNAVLRRAANEARPLIDALPARTPAEAALRHSHPLWIAELWFEQLGADAARALMAANNEPAEAAIRANSLKTTATALAAQLPAEPADLPGALVLTTPFDAFASPLWHDGLFMPQSRAAQAVSLALDPQPGDTVLDLCAAPGAKTTHLAALMRNEGRVTAVERHEGRAEALRRTASRMGATCVEVRTADAAEPQEGTYDRVLVDPPCSDLGTLASRPDARWRKQPHDVDELGQLQRRILDRGAEVVRPGGIMVYSTCTISPRENERQIEAFLGRHADFQLTDMPSDLPVWDHPTVPRVRQTFPHRDGTDGFFIARLRRA